MGLRGRDHTQRLGQEERRPPADGPRRPPPGMAVGAWWAQPGRAPGERATFLQFSTAFCRPCVATRRVLAEVAAMVPGVAHVDLDAESHLELVRALGVTQTPTVLVLDAAGRVVRRATGLPRRADVIAALGEALRDESLAR